MDVTTSPVKGSRYAFASKGVHSTRRPPVKGRTWTAFGRGYLSRDIIILEDFILAIKISHHWDEIILNFTMCRDIKFWEDFIPKKKNVITKTILTSRYIRVSNLGRFQSCDKK